MDSSWRSRIALTVAVCVWLVVWYGGWLLGGILVPGSSTSALLGGFAGWSAGLGLASLILFLNEGF